MQRLFLVALSVRHLMSLFDFLKHSIVQFDMQYMGKLATNPKIQSARRES